MLLITFQASQATFKLFILKCNIHTEKYKYHMLSVQLSNFIKLKKPV